jgi:hypothetical protein
LNEIRGMRPFYADETRIGKTSTLFAKRADKATCLPYLRNVCEARTHSLFEWIPSLLLLRFRKVLSWRFGQ